MKTFSFTHFEPSQILGLGKSEKFRWKPLTKQNLTGLSCAQVALESIGVLNMCILRTLTMKKQKVLFTVPTDKCIG